MGAGDKPGQLFLHECAHRCQVQRLHGLSNQRNIGLQNGQPPGEFTDCDQPLGLEWGQPGLPQFGKRGMASLVCLLSGQGML
ncbi:MAG TPA: hypothetical protein VFV38_35460 [Ktedonobacteraceae bacterium]|nr:hypothetical protein [Ktedonobacteraceae bacterium]